MLRRFDEVTLQRHFVFYQNPDGTNGIGKDYSIVSQFISLTSFAMLNYQLGIDVINSDKSGILENNYNALTMDKRAEYVIMLGLNQQLKDKGEKVLDDMVFFINPMSPFPPINSITFPNGEQIPHEVQVIAISRKFARNFEQIYPDIFAKIVAELPNHSVEESNNSDEDNLRLQAVGLQEIRNDKHIDPITMQSLLMVLPKQELVTKGVLSSSRLFSKPTVNTTIPPSLDEAIGNTDNQSESLTKGF